MEHPLLSAFIKITLFTLMLSLGVNQSFAHLRSLWYRPGSLLRSLLAVVVIFPLLVIMLLLLFDVPHEVTTGLAVLAAAPGAPLTHKRSALAGGQPIYSASLQLTVASLAIFTMPIILSIFYAFFQLDIEKVSVFEVARQVALVQFLPIGIGLLLQKIGLNFAAVIGKPLGILANILLLLLVGVLLFPSLRLILQVGATPIIMIVILVAASLTIGYLLGSPSLFRQGTALAVDERSALAVATIARNLGLAVLIVTIGNVQKTVLPTILAYTIVGALVAVPFSLWSKHQSAQAERKIQAD